MRILHVVPTYYPAVRYGGPIHSIHNLAAAVSGRGHEVHVYTTNVDGPNDLLVPLKQPVARDGVQVWYFQAKMGRRIYRSPEMGRALQSNVKNFDVVHLHSVFLWPTSAGAHAARRNSVPYVIAPRGMLVRDLIRKKSTLAKRAWIGLFERQNIKHAAAVQVTSEREATELRELGFDVQHVALVPNGIDIPRGAVSNATLDPERPFVLFLGRVNWEKGLDRLIPALTRVPHIDLFIAGNDEEGYRPVLTALAQQCGVADRVRFLGSVDAGRKWDLLRKAEMLVLPSYSESFGNVVLEAMAMGCPVVVTPEVGLAAAVHKAKAGLVADGNPEKIGLAMKQILQNPVAACRMGEAGRRTSAEQFSWSVIAEQMERVYEQCVREGQRGV